MDLFWPCHCLYWLVQQTNQLKQKEAQMFYLICITCLLFLYLGYVLINPDRF